MKRSKHRLTRQVGKGKSKNNIRSSKPSQSKSNSANVRSYKKVNAEIIPDYKIRFDNSFASVSMILKPNQTVFCNSGSMSWMDDKIKAQAKNRSGFFSGMKRMFLTDNSYFTTDYTGISPKGNKITFSPKLPGDIIALPIEPGTGLYISGDGFVAGTNNIVVATKTRWRNMLVNEDTFMTKISVPADSTSKGMVWVSSYGGIIKKTISPGEKLKVDTGHFVASSDHVNYKLGKVGGWMTMVLSGEGLVMTFEATDKPVTLYLQSRNFMQIVRMLHPFFAPRNSG